MRTDTIILNEERNVSLTVYLQEVGGEFRGVGERPAVLVIHGGGYTHGYSGAYASHLEGYGSNSSNGTNVGYRLACHADLSNLQ